MCYVRGVMIDTHEKHTKKQAQAYMHEQLNYFRMLMKEVFNKKEFGEEFEYLLSELREGPLGWGILAIYHWIIPYGEVSGSIISS